MPALTGQHTRTYWAGAGLSPQRGGGGSTSSGGRNGCGEVMKRAGLVTVAVTEGGAMAPSAFFRVPAPLAPRDRFKADRRAARDIGK